MASSAPSLEATNHQQLKKAQFDACDMALCHAADAASVASDFSSATAALIQSTVSGDTSVLDMMRFMGRGGPDEHIFDDFTTAAMFAVNSWIDADRACINKLNAAIAALFTATQHKMDRCPAGAFAASVSYIVPALEEKITIQELQVPMLEDYGRQGHGLAAGDTTLFRRQVARIKDSSALIKDLIRRIQAEIIRQQ
jgi:hypothetical protein